MRPKHDIISNKNLNMLFNRFNKTAIFFLLSLLFAIPNQAQEPDGYYANANGKSAATLKTSLHNIVREHTVLEYYSSSTYFLTTDWNPDDGGYIWDMYSNYKRTSWTYDMNREHSMPKSWWSPSATVASTVAYSDLNNLYPSDANANSAKLNYPLGEVGGDYLPNTIVKVGNNTYPGFTGTVFEPADEYKGDFARDYMYMVTCYEDYAQKWQNTPMLKQETYPVFTPWAINLLLKWHRQDPVSTKEITRNNAVYRFQNNRNPFIDHPQLAEFIWGKYVGELWPFIEIPLEIRYTKTNSLLTVKTLIAADATFSIKPSETSYFIQSMGGITLKTGKLASDGSISVAELKNGLYILVVYSGTKRKSGKFLVKRD